MNRFFRLKDIATRPRPPVGTTPADVIFRENKWRLLRYRPRPEGIAYQTPVLLVPSLINRHYVMDLLPGRSMAEDLVKAGHDVYCIDWGTPGDEDRYLEFDDFCDKYLGRAIRVVAKRTPRKKIHVLGYCLGGTLATIHATVHQEHIASLLLLATPVKFEDDGLLSQWTRQKDFQVSDIVDAYGNIPWQLMQASFQMLRPTLNLAKAMTVIDRAADDEFLDGFFAIETWGNDNVSFPGKCYEQYIERLYRNDMLIKDELRVSGRPAKLGAIKVPTACVVFEDDTIVPWQSAAMVLDKIASTDKELWKLRGGHVGAVVSKSGQKKLWPRMSAWWAARDAEGTAVATQAPKLEPPKPSPNDELAKMQAELAELTALHAKMSNGSNGANGHAKPKKAAKAPASRPGGDRRRTKPKVR